MQIFKLLKRWCNMIFGKSSFHVEQGVGKYYSKNEIRGYYNDMTNKVSDLIELDDKGIPINTTIAITIISPIFDFFISLLLLFQILYIHSNLLKFFLQYIIPLF